MVIALAPHNACVELNRECCRYKASMARSQGVFRARTQNVSGGHLTDGYPYFGVE